MTNPSIPLIEHISAKITLSKFNVTEEDIMLIGENICKKIGLNIVRYIENKYKPIGYTLVFILSESHLAIHTWPEHNLIHIDLLSCKKINVEEFNDTLKKLLANFNLSNFESCLHEM